MSKIYVLSKGALATKKNGKLVAIDSFEAPINNCEPGVDSCQEYTLVWNFNSESGDKVLSAMYIVDGVPVISSITDAKAAIAAFKANTLVSAASVTISGCLAGTELKIGSTRQLTKTVLPAGSLQTGTWSTSDAGVATVSVGGLVTGVSVGTATITFTTTDGGFTATCAVEVILADATSSAIAGCLPEVDLVEGATRQLTGSVIPVGALQTGTWLSSDPLTATVNGSGLVTAVAAGTANITFTSTDGSFVSTCVVTVVGA